MFEYSLWRWTSTLEIVHKHIMPRVPLFSGVDPDKLEVVNTDLGESRLPNPRTPEPEVEESTEGESKSESMISGTDLLVNNHDYDQFQPPSVSIDTKTDAHRPRRVQQSRSLEHPHHL